jgi:SAM-dependent methyltransferase
VWEGSIHDGKYNFQDGKSGHQYICEGSSLSFSEDARYDLLLSSHSLEHHANVLGTLKEWMRVVKPGGLLLIVVPEKRYTFDHKRQYTDFEHFIEDERNGVDERDLTHLDEILQLHDLSLDPGASDREFFKNRALQNFENRCLHHHVFNFENLGRIAEHLGLEVIASQFVPPFHNIIFLRKPSHS